VQRGRSEAKKSFFILIVPFAERFFIFKRKFNFFVSIFPRGAGGELEK
jgi:hypothetical protein